MKTNAFKRKLESSEPQIGLWLSLCSNIAADALADAGFDWLMIDMEHSPNDPASVLSQLHAIGYGDTVPLVRPPWKDAVMVKRLLDLGAPGLLFPMVESGAEAAEMVAACRYPPRGIRGVSGLQRGNRFARDPDYFATVEEETAILVQIESVEAMNRVEEIAETDGVDGIFFGPADISASMGRAGRTDDAEVWDRILDCAGAARARGCPVGTLTGNMEIVDRVLGEGFAFVAVGTDLSTLVKGADATLRRARG